MRKMSAAYTQEFHQEKHDVAIQVQEEAVNLFWRL